MANKTFSARTHIQDDLFLFVSFKTPTAGPAALAFCKIKKQNIALTTQFRYCTLKKKVSLNHSLQRSNRSDFSPNNEDSRSQSSSRRAAFEGNRLPGDNLINQLPVISTPNHSCRRQIAFPSSSLGPCEDRSEGVCLITQMPPHPTRPCLPT